MELTSFLADRRVGFNVGIEEQTASPLGGDGRGVGLHGSGRLYRYPLYPVGHLLLAQLGYASRSAKNGYENLGCGRNHLR